SHHPSPVQIRTKPGPLGNSALPYHPFYRF
ncbi:MAG: hypothetical protein ACI8P0_002498, partial [Planctomycetaceae bacterium]